MKKFFSKMMLFAVLAVAVCACNSKNQPEDKSKVNYDKMIGKWKVSSYTVKWINLDESKELKNIALTDGSLEISKQTEDGETYYYYTENFINENRTDYSGRIDVSDRCIELRNRQGFLRDDGADTYEFVVSFPSDKQMEWTYEWKGERTIDGVSHQEQRSVKAIFNK